MNRIFKVALMLMLTTLSAIAQRYNFKAYTVNDGLAQSNVTALVQDDYGYIWAGTKSGLSRFDGLHFTNYGFNDGLPDQNITSLLFAQKVLWVGTEDGLRIFDGTRFLKPNSTAGLFSSETIAMAETEKGLYAITSREVYFIERTVAGYHVDSLNIRNFTEEQRFQTLLVDRDQNLWLSANGSGIYVIMFNLSQIPATSIDLLRSYRGKSMGKDIEVLHLRPENGLKGINISCMLEDQNGSIWYADWRQGPGRIDIPVKASEQLTFLDFTTPQYQHINWGTTRMQCMYKDSEGNIWFGSDGFGITKLLATNKKVTLLPNTIRHYYGYNGLYSNHPTVFCEDAEKNMWIGTANDGLSRLSGERFITYSSERSINGTSILSIYRDKMGGIWAGTYGNGVIYHPSGLDSSRKFSWEDGISESIVTSITEDRWGGVWMGTTGGGISILPLENRDKQGKVFSVLDSDKNLPWNFVSALASDSSGNIYVGMQSGGGVVRIRPSSSLGPYDIQPVADGEAIVKGSVLNIKVDAKGDVWILTNTGLMQLSPEGEVLNKWEKKENHIYGEIQCFAQDKYENIWLGTKNNGVLILKNKKKVSYLKSGNPDSVETIGASFGFASVNVTNIYFDRNSTVWCGTRNGLHQLMYDKNGKIETLRIYNSIDALWTNEINPNTFITDKASNFWFGATNGYTKFLPQTQKVKQNVLLHLESIRVNFIDIRDTTNNELKNVISGTFSGWFGLPSRIKLPASNSTIQFIFSGIQHEAPDRIRYQYMLEGYDPNWSPPTRDREVIYRGLPPGEYRLKARAINASGEVNERAVIFSFSVKAPFYQTWAFYILMVVVFGLAFWIFTRLRERALLRSKEQLEVLVGQRTTEVMKQKDEMEKQAEVIRQKNIDITSSIEYAQRIQRSILPDPQLLDTYFAENFIYYKPRDIVSGDFYWIAEKDDCIYIAAVDCTGHGVPGAFMSLISFNLLNEALIVSSEPLSELLINLRTSLFQQLQSYEKGTVIYDGLDISIMCFDKSSGKASFTNSNRPTFIVQNGQMIALKSCKLSIGGLAFETEETFDVTELFLRPGDTIYMFTDGITDQFGGPRDKRYSRLALERLITKIHHTPLHEQHHTISTSIDQWRGKEEQMDDMLLIGIKV
jgi:ligand-binding sensor domain-containing protein/serine phosphatase RsbU (regulator of sigma subunit)